MKFSDRLTYKLLIRFLFIITLVLLIYTIIWLMITQNAVATISSQEAEQTAQLIKKIKIYATFLFIATVIFAALLYLTLTNSIINAFSKLKEGFEHFNNGDIAFQINVTSKDEIADLARALNKMVGDIHNAYIKVEDDKAAVQKQRENERKAFAAEQEKLHQEFTEEQKKMNQNLMDEKEKVNNGLFVEKEKMTAILSHVTDALLLLNKNRQIILINKKAEDLLGYTASEVVNKPITEIVKLFEKDREMALDEYTPLQDATMGKGEAFMKKQIRLENPKNTSRFVDIITVKTNFSKQEDSGYIIVLHSIADEKALEKKTLNFASAVARELKSPLGMMAQCVSFLTKSDPPVSDDDKKAYLMGVQSSINQLSSLMENMVTISRIEEGSLNLNIQTMDLVPFVRQATVDIAPLTAMKNITINFEEPKESMNVNADQTTIATVLINLLNNANKYTPPTGTITIQIRKLGEEIFVEVQDTGVGIPKDAISNLFQKFSTIPNPQTPDEEGTGLGLYICKSLVELQHGKIWMDSVEGKGSTFSFSLPMATN